ncbi:hypothetical protein QVD99_000983 [Batrachochytrium dendrobatidis]|nr:hypothetical protein O5D80_008683 [Batrachochytrium dendrobatidis]KAK5673541.1 hypothetical protein QVD99_000983 [Batrachochytrium dendrobatidis]
MIFTRLSLLAIVAASVAAHVIIKANSNQDALLVKRSGENGVAPSDPSGPVGHHQGGNHSGSTNSNGNGSDSSDSSDSDSDSDHGAHRSRRRRR